MSWRIKTTTSASERIFLIGLIRHSIDTLEIERRHDALTFLSSFSKSAFLAISAECICSPPLCLDIPFVFMIIPLYRIFAV